LGKKHETGKKRTKTAIYIEPDRKARTSFTGKEGVIREAMEKRKEGLDRLQEDGRATINIFAVGKNRKKYRVQRLIERIKGRVVKGGRMCSRRGRVKRLNFYYEEKFETSGRLSERSQTLI